MNDIRYIQDVLVNNDLIVTLYSIVTSHRIEKVVQENAIFVMIALLIGGNNSAQTAIYKQMSKDVNNVFLLNIKDIINHSFNKVKTTMSKLNKQFFQNMILLKNIEKS